MPANLLVRLAKMANLKATGNELPNRDFSRMDLSKVRQLDTASWIGVLPLGATEQHGPHLPLETDTLIANGVVERLKSALPQELAVSFLKTEPVVYSPEHLDYAGTKSLTYQEAIERWISIGENLNSLGIRKLVLLNAHGGNSPMMTIVATELRVRFSMLCVVTSWTRIGRPKGVIDESKASIDIHGGDIETSVMLALHPDKVKMSKAADFGSEQTRLLQENTYLHAYGRHAFGWKMQDLNPIGVTGDAKAASAEKGEKLLEYSVKGLIQLFAEVDRFDVSVFDRSI